MALQNTWKYTHYEKLFWPKNSNIVEYTELIIIFLI